MKMLVSACLLGSPVRYDGAAKPLDQISLHAMVTAGRVIGFCPEVAGGLAVPRKPAEIQSGNGDDVVEGRSRVVTIDGDDVTDYFLSGAKQALELCRQHDISVAVLTECSPSCGSSQIYDGNFDRNAIAGSGVTAALLQRNGIRVFNQYQVDEAIRCLPA